MWRIEHCADRKTWVASHVRRSSEKDRSHHEGIVPKRRSLIPGESGFRRKETVID